MARKPKDTEETIAQVLNIPRLERGEVTLTLLGSSPLICNRMFEKAKHELLLPARKMNAAERESILKHDPLTEYRNSVYRCRDERAPTAVHLPTGAFKKALANAALETPGATKAGIGRLVKILDETVFVYGIPQLFMAVVRQAGIARTPDIRTRAIFPSWCVSIRVQYIRTRIREQDIINLSANAGDIIGVGDGRTEKGTFDYGAWGITAMDDPEVRRIMKEGGRTAQLKALEHPECFDADSEEMLVWFDEELKRRERTRGEEKPKGKGKGKDIPEAAVIAEQSKRGNGRSRRAK